MSVSCYVLGSRHPEDWKVILMDTECRRDQVFKVGMTTNSKRPVTLPEKGSTLLQIRFGQVGAQSRHRRSELWSRNRPACLMRFA